MAIFVTQGRFTREYIRSGLAKPEDRQAAGQAAALTNELPARELVDGLGD